MSEIQFREGNYDLNPYPLFNYQLNRLIMWNEADPEEVVEYAGEIHDFKSWEETLKKLSKVALERNQIHAAAGCLRMAEFFMDPELPETLEVYEKARGLFYRFNAALFDEKNGIIQNNQVPFETGFLTCWKVEPEGIKKGTLLFQGGNDSLLEEFLKPVLYLAGHGYEVIAFEGPGQGAVLRRYGLKFLAEWERPVKAVLDYYQTEEAALIGVSLGGELVQRAATYEPRIKKVVSWCPMMDLYDAVLANKPAEIQAMVTKLLDAHEEEKVVAVYRQLEEKNPVVKWSIKHSNYAYGTRNVYEYLQKAKGFSVKNSAGRITQDVLLIGAREDSMVDFSLYKQAVDLLENARTLTFEVPGRAVHGQTHCNMGNTKLVLDCILNWLASI